MDVSATLPTDQQAAVGVQPGEGALDFPTVVAQLLAGLDAAPSDTGLDAAATAP